MANKLRRQFSYSVGPGHVHIGARVPVNTAGVLGTPVGKGIKSVSRTAAGAYTVNFDDKYIDLLSAVGMVDVNPDNAVTNTCADGYLCQLAGEWVAGVAGVNGGDGYAKVDVFIGGNYGKETRNCPYYSI